MSLAVSLDNELVKIAKIHSLVQSRSVPKQIEHWARIGRIAEENPDLSYAAIKGMLMGLEDMKVGNVEPYRAESL